MKTMKIQDFKVGMVFKQHFSSSIILEKIITIENDLCTTEKSYDNGKTFEKSIGKKYLISFINGIKNKVTYLIQ